MGEIILCIDGVIAMQCKTKGCYGESEYFFHTASTLAKDLFYYMDDCGHIFCGKDYMIRRQVYNNYLLMYVVSGQLDIENDGITHSVYPHQVVLMNCHNAHRYGSPIDTEFWYVHFDGSNIERIYQHIKKTIGVVSTVQNESQILEPLKLLVSSCKHRTNIPDTEIAKQIYTLLCNIIFPQCSNTAHNMSENEIINQAIDYITEHYAEDLSLNSLAEQFHMSVGYFSHLFKQYAGQSAYELIISTRLDKAKYLLTTTDLSIAEIAYQIGYNSSNGFISAFSKRIGVSPKRFRIYFDSVN